MVQGKKIGRLVAFFFNLKISFVGELGIEESSTYYGDQKGQIRPLKLEVPLWLGQVNSCLLGSLKLKTALRLHPNFLLEKIVPIHQMFLV